MISLGCKFFAKRPKVFWENADKYNIGQAMDAKKKKKKP